MGKRKAEAGGDQTNKQAKVVQVRILRRGPGVEGVLLTCPSVPSSSMMMCNQNGCKHTNMMFATVQQGAFVLTCFNRQCGSDRTTL